MSQPPPRALRSQPIAYGSRARARARLLLTIAAWVVVSLSVIGLSTQWRKTLGKLEGPEAKGAGNLRLLVPEGMLGQPRWSPDGKLVAYVSFSRFARVSEGPEPHFMMITATGGKRRDLGAFEGAHFPFEGRRFAWMPDSQELIYLYTEPADDHVRGRSDTATRAANRNGVRRPEGKLRVRTALIGDGRRTDLTSPARSGITDETVPSDAYVAVSPARTEIALLVWKRSGSAWDRHVAVVDLMSGAMRLVTDCAGDSGRMPASFNELAWQGTRIYFVCENEGRRVPADPLPGQGTIAAREIWSVREDGTDLRQETSGPEDGYPAPRPAGRELAFLRNGSICLRDPKGQVRTVVRAADDGSEAYGRCEGPISWSPDGKQLAFVWLGRRTGIPSIWVTRVPPP